jgi:hypothetical protein
MSAAAVTGARTTAAVTASLENRLQKRLIDV